MNKFAKAGLLIGLGPVGGIIIGVDNCVQLNKQINDFKKENEQVTNMLKNNAFPKKACNLDPQFTTI